MGARRRSGPATAGRRGAATTPGTEEVEPRREQRPTPGTVTLGRITGLFGVRGWIKVHSYTRPPETILQYGPWSLKTPQGVREFKLAEGQVHGRGIVARLEGCTDRDQATVFVGADIEVAVSRMPKLKPGEYYWSQLEGLKVINLAGQELGVVEYLFETGANDVLVVAGEREWLIPYTRTVVQDVNLDTGILRVDWDESF